MDDGEFVRTIYDASYRRLVGQLVVATGDLAEAEDAVQEAFARAVNHARTFRDTDNPEAWLRVVALNVARSRWRRMQRWAGLQPRLAPAPSYDDNTTPERVALLEALKRLPVAQREAIALHHLADLQVSEIADQLGVPAGTVKARLSRGRKALAALLGEPHTGARTEEVHDG